ncbi:hypothetical protein LOAG_05779 [Loa loa]|uniref:Uncharacterized protein n=1 Tax=Loa loa TaxID=7209 RepID=A0A1S0TZ63_LOALO|nr:hypothetical protein LOAG_05779 [Loa loa]EFO22703.1 hypothetical protein LOAG_05779 [Loa loa]
MFCLIVKEMQKMIVVQLSDLSPYVEHRSQKYDFILLLSLSFMYLATAFLIINFRTVPKTSVANFSKKCTLECTRKNFKLQKYCLSICIKSNVKITTVQGCKSCISGRSNAADRLIFP